MIKTKATTTERDRGYSQVIGQLKLLEKSPKVDVGYFSGGGESTEDGPVSVAEYMFINETGTTDGTIPPRPVSSRPPGVTARGWARR